MTYLGWLAAGIAVVLGATATGSATAETTSRPRFCLVPVVDGAPTHADSNDAWRMLSRVVILPGIPRPIIYAENRGGVWTIDDSRGFVRFGGTFPSNILHDQYAVDAESGTVAAIGPNGLFTIGPGETSFTAVASNAERQFQRPFSVAFVERWKRFVVTDEAGVFLWARSRPVETLDSSDARKATGAVFDLPSIRALLVTVRGANDNERVTALRYDDGRLETMVELGQWDFIVGGETSADGRDLIVRTYRQTITFRKAESGHYEKISTENDKVNPIARPFEPANRPAVQRLETTPENGRTMFYLAPLGVLFVDGKARQINLPFDQPDMRVRDSMEMPASRVLILFTSQTAYSVDATGQLEEVERAGQLAGGRLPPAQGVIPGRNEMLVLGPKALYLLVDKKLSGEQACAH